jgi:NAD(P)-dependent dehydrogenase (short-subunit alcohol dehydrogenase family)
MNGKIAVVTGAGTGIGKGAAAALVAEGWTTIFCGRRMNVLEDAAATAKGPGKAVPIACDVTDEKQVDELFTAVEREYGHLDLLFNNAGMGARGATIDELSVELWRQVVEVNLTGSFLCARAAFGLMRRQSPQGGRIVNNGSISAYAPRPGSAPYTATKHAITGLTRTLALDGRPFDIACGQIDIGNALTDLAAKMADGVPQADGRIAPEPLMDVKAVADAVTYMAGLPLDANVLFLTVMATKMPFVGRG